MDEEEIYRYLDRLSKSQSGILDDLRSYIANSYPSALTFILYDVTTLYFESDSEDEDDKLPGLRKRGYSKDKRDDLPQVVLGLGVNSLGMPLTFRLYPGNTYEGSTLLDGVDETLSVFGQRNITVVGDAGMLSEKNLAQLEERGLTYIVGARLKSLPSWLQRDIWGLDFTQDTTHEISYRGRRLIISYSPSRAKRAQWQRKRSIERLEKLIEKNQAIRKHQYLDFSITERPKLDTQAIEAAARWDGIKGYITNNFTLGQSAVIGYHGDLYKIEQSFRMSKTDLKIRPAFHYAQSRIEAHVIICMLALCVLRMLEHQVKPVGMTYKAALDEISLAKAAVLGLGDQSFTVPPAYTSAMRKIIASLDQPTPLGSQFLAT